MTIRWAELNFANFRFGRVKKFELFVVSVVSNLSLIWWVFCLVVFEESVKFSLE